MHLAPFDPKTRQAHVPIFRPIIHPVVVKDQGKTQGYKQCCKLQHHIFKSFVINVILFLSDLQKLINTRQQLDAQLNENKVVQEVKDGLMIYLHVDRFT